MQSNDWFVIVLLIVSVVITVLDKRPRRLSVLEQRALRRRTNLAWKDRGTLK